MTRARFGPALIVASVVLGPGSILLASRVGSDFGYSLLWVPLLAAALMAGTTWIAARLGVQLTTSPCEAVATHAGRPLAALTGVVLFAIVACFQFSNNLGVIAALQPLVGGGRWSVAAVAGVNLVCLLAVFGVRRLYVPLERTMKLLVVAMAIGFLANLLLARPDLGAAAAGLWPSLPDEARGALWPHREGDTVVDPLLPVVGLIGTTFSVAGAFYQAYLVREKGWSAADLGVGFRDSLTGIAVLAALSATVLCTAAAVLHGSVRGVALHSAADVARQLEPLFGRAAAALFCAGLFAGAFSSFVVNAMIGGTALADGLGLGSRMDQKPVKVCTAAALITGMLVALWVEGSGRSPVELITVAQALTVLGNPLLAAILLWLTLRTGGSKPLVAVATVGLAVTVVLAARTATRLALG